MADLKVNIIATDRASPSINKVGQAVTSLAQQFGGLSGGIGRLANQLGGLIGAGGMAGMAIGAVALAANLEDLKNEFADWATGMGKAGEGLDELDQKTQRYIETLKGLQRQLELVGLAGVARAAAEMGLAQAEVVALRQKLDLRKEDVTRLEALREEQAKGFGIKGIGFVTPGLKVTEESLKKAKQDTIDLTQALGAAQTQLSIVAKTLTFEETEEGKKRLQELDKTLQQTAEQNYKNMQQINAAVEEEIELVTKWAKERLDLERDISKIQQEINELGRARLEKSLGTGVTEEAIEAGLEKNAATAKKIIGEYNEGLEEQQRIFIKLNDARERQAEQNRQEWENMLNTIQEGAGRIFDAMLTKGQSVFSSLANFAQGVLQTMLRGVFQNAVAGLFSMGKGGGGLSSLFGIGGATATGALGGIIRGGGGGARLQESIVGGATKSGGGFLGGLFGGGAAGAVGLGGTLAAGAATAGIATAVALGASFISGLFQGGANRRAAEQARRAGLIAENQFAAPETLTRFGIAGGAGYSVESDLTGSIRGIGVTPTVIVNVQNNMIDARHAREAGEVIGQEVSRQILSGGSLLADNIAWSAS
jgi:hypothetical protein